MTKSVLKTLHPLLHAGNSDDLIYFSFPFPLKSTRESNSSKIIVGFRARKHLFNSILSPLQMDYHAEAAGQS